MADEVTQGEAIVLTGDQIEVGRWLRVRSMLKLEIGTSKPGQPGLRHSRGSVMLAANRITGYDCRTKKSAYDALDKFITEKLGADFAKPRKDWGK